MPHNYRKTVATMLDQSGLSARTIANQLGHLRTSTTQDVYLGRRAVDTAAAFALEAFGGSSLATTRTLLEPWRGSSERVALEWIVVPKRNPRPLMDRGSVRSVL